MKHLLLIAEASPAEAEELSVAARRAGLEATILSDPGRLLQQADLLLPSAVVLAADLDGQKGWALANRLKRHRLLGHLPLVLTAAGDQAPAVFAQHQRLATRADLYLRRPYQPAELLSRLEPLLATPRPELLERLYRLREKSPPEASPRSILLWALVATAAVAFGLVLYYFR